MTTTSNDSRIDELRNIARAIRAAAIPFSEADGARADAVEAANAARENATGKRELAMSEMARLADAGGWSIPDIDTAAGMACGVAVSNEALPKSVATFIGEAKRAMHPKVRSLFPRLAALRSEVWAAEKEMRKANRDCRAPLMDACAREYHAIIQMMGAVIDGKATFTNTADVTAWAEARNPALDAKRQHGAVADMLDKLAAIANNFPDQDLQSAVDTLRAVTAESMKAARDDLLGAENQRMQQHNLAPIPAVVAEKVEAATAPNEQDAIDPLDAALDQLAA